MDYQTQLKTKRWLNKPFITYGFLGIQTIVFVITALFPHSSLESSGVMFGPFVYFYHEYWRFVTPIFIHFSLLHFAVNSIVLYFIGQQVEAIYGHWRFLILYLLSGVLGNAMSFAFNTAGVQSAGSSTSIFGIFGAFLLLGYYFKHNPAIQGMVRQFALFVGMSLLFGIFDQSIDMWGHIGGIIGGLLIGNILALPKNHGKFSIHARIISVLIFSFLIVLCLVYGLRKYSLLIG
ncbi:rhomboid family intramembrane serine protease [Enterococcus massiliensis]|uniref:rhomboid family intramembrane serine protease n=1 Tax=Enterococcus massiliensis TaxID=1640685 RepID=UPI00065E9909|nr:rhomboid family intramembrane serine protease [Enterococcus massiliensis]